MSAIAFDIDEVGIGDEPFGEGDTFQDDMVASIYETMVVSKDSIHVTQNMNELLKTFNVTMITNTNTLASMGRIASTLTFVGGSVGTYQAIKDLKASIKNEHTEGKVLNSFEVARNVGILIGGLGSFLSTVLRLNPAIKSAVSPFFLLSALISIGMASYELHHVQELKRELDVIEKIDDDKNMLERFYHLIVGKTKLTDSEISMIINNEDFTTSEDERLQAVQKKLYAFCTNYGLENSQYKNIRTILVLYRQIFEAPLNKLKRIDRLEPYEAACVRGILKTFQTNVKKTQIKKWFTIFISCIFILAAILTIASSANWVLIVSSALFALGACAMMIEHIAFKYRVLPKMAQQVAQIIKNTYFFNTQQDNLSLKMQEIKKVHVLSKRSLS